MVDIEHGFWKVRPYTVAPSKSQIYCNFLSEHFEIVIVYQIATSWARHIVELHNQWWDAYVWDTYHNNIEWTLGHRMHEFYEGITEDEWFEYDELDGSSGR